MEHSLIESSSPFNLSGPSLFERSPVGVLSSALMMLFNSRNSSAFMTVMSPRISLLQSPVFFSFTRPLTAGGVGTWLPDVEDLSRKKVFSFRPKEDELFSLTRSCTLLFAFSSSAAMGEGEGLSPLVPAVDFLDLCFPYSGTAFTVLKIT